MATATGVESSAARGADDEVELVKGSAGGVEDEVALATVVESSASCVADPVEEDTAVATRSTSTSFTEPEGAELTVVREDTGGSGSSAAFSESPDSPSSTAMGEGILDTRRSAVTATVWRVLCTDKER